MTENGPFQPRSVNWLTALNGIVLLVMIVLLFSACGEKRPKTYRVGILVSFPKFSVIADVFKKEMAALGYREGENIIYEQQEVHLDPEGERRVVEKYVREKVDLIFAFPTSASVSAKTVAQGTGIPVLFAVAAIEGNNLVESVRRPGGNITGVRYPGPDLTLKRFELMQELLPDLKRLYVTYNPDYPANKVPLEVLRKAASASNVTLVENPIRSVEDIRRDLAARDTGEDIGLDAIQLLPDDISQSADGWSQIGEFADRHRVPVSGSGAVELGPMVVFNYGLFISQYGELAAPLAHKILQGTPAGSIPVISAEPHLLLNYRRARELGLTVPESWLGMATEIIH